MQLGLGVGLPFNRILGASDALAGVLLALRLQTHNGNGVPVGLYQDIACTIPATEAGHSIAAWRDEIGDSGLVALQANVLKQPTLQFVSGVPVVQFDGVDDILMVTSSWGFTECCLSVAFFAEPKPGGNQYCVAEHSPSNDSWWRYTDGNGYFGVFRTNRVDPFPASPPTEGEFMVSVCSGASYQIFVNGASVGSTAGAFEAGANLAIGGDSASVTTKTLQGWISGLIIATRITDRAAVETYLGGLMP